MRSNAAKWIAALGVLVLIVAIVIWKQAGGLSSDGRLYRIGWENDPPFQFQGEDGKPTGLAIDLVSEAAGRRRIQLQWIQQSNGSEASLKSGKVDLWPLITITPERTRLFHISDPYLDTNLCLLVRTSSRFKEVRDLQNASVGYNELPINFRYARDYLPNVRLVGMSTLEQMIEGVCSRQTDAALLEEYSVITALLGGASCAGVPLRMIPIPGPRPVLGVGATFGARAAADAIREEIGVMAAEGRLAQILMRWGYVSGQNLESVEALLNARRRERLLIGTVTLFAALFVSTLWQAIRIQRERNRTRQAEKALRETEERFRTIVEMAPDGIFFADTGGRFLEVNKAACASLAYTREELLRKSVREIVPERIVSRLDADFRTISSEGGYSFESIHRTSDGTERPVELNVRKVLFGDRPAYVAIARDITERKRAEEALLESERRFRELLGTVRLAALMFDLKGTITFCNDFLLDITGWTAEEVIGHSYHEFLAPDHKDFVEEAIESALGGGKVRTAYEDYLLTKEGKQRWIQWNNTSLRDAGGQLVGMASLGVDVTEHRVLQEQYLQSQKLESVGRLAGGVAHDFNNLLTVINGYCDILFRLLKEGDPLLEYIEQIRKAGERAAGLTQQLLAFSRKQVIQPRPLNLNIVVSDSEAMLKRIVGEDISVETILGQPLGPVMADPGQIHQVLMNLVVNARDAMPNGGKITIETSNLELDDSYSIHHPEIKAGPYVLLAVSDTGAGMDKETMSLIFEPFFTTKAKGHGTGLGLSMVYGIVRQSRGWIWPYSEPGRGSTFKIYLPRMDVLAPGGAIADSAAIDARGSETILVVEDQEEVRQLAVVALQSHGYSVFAAADGIEALSLAEQHAGPIHLVLTDVVLPGMNGRALAERLKQLRPEMRVLFTSGYTENVIAHRGVLDRGIDFIPKPYAPHALAAKIREVLRADPTDPRP